MSSYTSISSDKLARLIGTAHAPVLVDVRLDEDFDADPRLIPARSGVRIATSRLGLRSLVASPRSLFAIKDKSSARAPHRCSDITG